MQNNNCGKSTIIIYTKKKKTNVPIHKLYNLIFTDDIVCASVIYYLFKIPFITIYIIPTYLTLWYARISYKTIMPAQRRE